jgi:hypothetical protein
MAETTDQGVKADTKAYQRVPARFWPEISPKGMRRIAALIANEDVAVEDACLLEGYAPGGLAAMLEGEQGDKYTNMLAWAKADSRRKWLKRLHEASEAGRGAGAAETLLKAIDARFQPKVVEGGSSGLTIQFVVVGGEGPKVRELETRVIQVDPQKRLGDGS